MEHSALHALVLIGLVLALGGAFAVLGLIKPAARASGAAELTGRLITSVGRWTVFGALAAAFATGVDFIVQLAEIRGQTIFAGADLTLMGRFATQHMLAGLNSHASDCSCWTAGAACIGGKRKWWLTDSATMNMLLYKEVMKQLAANGGKVPQNFLDR